MKTPQECTKWHERLHHSHSERKNVSYETEMLPVEVRCVARISIRCHQTSGVDQMICDDQPVSRTISDSRRPRTISNAVLWFNMFENIVCFINIKHAIFLRKSVTKIQYKKVFKLAILAEPKTTHNMRVICNYILHMLFFTQKQLK